MKQCLIVDDSPTIRKIARRILEELGFTCFEAEDGAVAAEFCRNQMPDLVLLDWNMPNVSGIEFLRMLRVMDNGSHPKVVFCTTETGMDFVQNGMNAGADEYIMKPFDRDLLQIKLIQVGILEESI